MERQLVELAKGLQGFGWSVHVLVFYGGGSLALDLDDAGVPWSVIGKSGRWDFFGFVWNFVRRIRLERPDVLYSFLVEPNLISVMTKPLLRGAKVVWGVRVSNLDLRHYDAFSRATFRASVWMSRFADLIIANSYAGEAHHVLNGYSRKRMTVIHNGIDTQRFSPSLEAATKIRAEWGIGEERFVGLVARLHPMKDHANFLRAASLVEDPNVRFVCIGKGSTPYEHQLKELAARLNLAHRLIWTGEVRDTASAFSALDLVCMSSSDGEGFPNVIGEAMSCGVPCVVTDVGDAALVVGGNGLVVPPRNSAALAHAIGALLAEDPGDQAVRRQEARKRIVETFSAPVMVSRTISALESLVDS